CACSVRKLKTKSSIKVKITEDSEGIRLDKFLSSLEEINSRTLAQNLIEKNCITVNGKPAKASMAVSTGQVVEINLPEPQPTELVPYDLKLEILFEDDDLIIVNKPAGLVVHPSAGHQQDTLVNALLHHTKNLSMKYEERPGIVHRIDKETSGLLVVAKNDFAHEILSAQFKNKTAHRIYYALVDKNILRPSGTCRSYLARHPVDRKRYASVRLNNKIVSEFTEGFESGKWAVTHFTRLAHQANMSYLKIKLETGRTHQIRVHMSELGHPLVGDMLYGYSLKKAKELGLQRFYLHAAELGIEHPRTREYLEFKAPWPQTDENKLLELGFKREVLSK
ncbi:MAG: pseudouridylate synthase, partial [Pseudobdellovibrio sp.]|nr:pseudouridylate synthase [Pseudobdellovibrio sp.]